jgi:NADPH2:quinone reductase
VTTGHQPLAARLVAPGEPLRVSEVELSDPGPDEARVELAFAGLNPFDGYNALGQVGADGPLPRTLGGEGAGLCSGRRVLVVGGPYGMGLTRDGTWSGAANVPNDAMVEIPDGVELRDAATMAVAGQTAWQAVRTLGQVGPGDRVVVLGAAGGVGSIAVSLAAAAGARVWGQTSRPERATAILDAGAHEVLVGGPETLAGLQPTVALDGLGGRFTGALIEALCPSGRLVAYGTSAGAQATVNLQALYRNGITLLGYASRHFRPDERTTALRGLLAALADGTLRVRIDDVVPLKSVNEALDRLRARSVVGKLVLELAERTS